MTQQIVDQRTLRKLLRRVEEIPEVKLYLEGFVDSEKAKLSNSSISDLLGMKKVKENQHMTALLTEILTYLEANDSEAAGKAARRVLEAEPVKIPEKFVKENQNLALASGSIEPVSE